MKKFILIFLLLAAGCGQGDREVLAPDAEAHARAGGGYSPLMCCNGGYTWTSGLSSDSYTVIPNVEWRRYFHYWPNEYPASNSAGHVCGTGAPYYFTIKVENIGASTWKYSVNGFHWYTLAAGASRNINIQVPYCCTSGPSCAPDVVFHIVRLTCGNLGFRSRFTAVMGPHSLSGSNCPDFYDTWNAPACTL